MNTYTKKITEIQAEKIKKILEAQGAVFDVINYSKWRGKTLYYQATYYISGKLLVQGKEISNIVNRIESEIFDNCPKNQKEIIYHDKYIGTDESGKGDFFGPLIAAGVQIDNSNKQKFKDIGVKDSKKLTDKKILELAGIIKANSIHSIIIITPKKYNELYKRFNNLNKLLAWAHSRAIENILIKSPCKYAIADKFGDETLIKNALLKNGKQIELKQMVRAESDIAVAAASILARAEFVKQIKNMEAKYSLTFSKGVSSQVIEQANNFIKLYSFNRLNEIAKLHFKTTNELICQNKEI